MANWQPFTVKEVVTDISENKIVLPVIQRRLVWEEGKMELLFDTLLKGNSFGGIMVIEEEKEKEPLFAFRYFSKDGSDIDSINVKKLNQTQVLVIDGQQRLQSFYIGLCGSYLGKVMYFDLFSDYKSLDFDFDFESEYEKLPKLNNDRTDKAIRECNWYSANSLYNRLKDTDDEDQVAKEIAASLSITDDVQKEHIDKNVRYFYRNIFLNKNIGFAKVSVNKSLDENGNRQRIVELFRRLNDGGTKLSAFEIVASILKGFDWKMEKFLDKTTEKYSEIGLNQDNLVKLIFLLRDEPSKEMTEITVEDANFAITNSDRIEITLKALKDFLIHSKLYNYYKNSNHSFIPLYFVAYHLFHKDVDNEKLKQYFDNFDVNNQEFTRMYKWIYYSLINGVFKSKGAGWIPYKTGVRKILQEIKQYKNLDFPTDNLFNIYFNHPVTFTIDFTYEKINLLDSSFVYYLIYDREQIIRAQDIDHIHPKSILEKLEIGWDKINSICNFQLLDSATNRWDKSASPLKNWINENVSDKLFYLDKHLIPNNELLWDENNFSDFLMKRFELITEKIDKYLNNR